MKKIYPGIALLVLLATYCPAQQIEMTELGIKAALESIDVEVQFYSSAIVRILKSPKGELVNKNSFSVIKKPEKSDLKISEQGNEVVVASSELVVKLNRTTGRISFYRVDLKQLLAEKDNGAQFTSFKDVDEDGYMVGQAFKLDEDEAIYGLGQFQDGKMIQRNQKLYLLQDILITAIPFFQSIKGYGLFWDNYSPTYFTDNTQVTSFESTVGDCVDYYFMYGENADGVIARMRELTGQAPMFPFWTYGYWQSKERYKSQVETVGVVKKYRELGVPLDGIIQDWQYWGDNYHWNSMEFGNPDFPDPQKMIDQVHDLNAHMIISIWSSFGPKTKPYKELEENDMLFDFKTWPLSGKDGWPPDMDYPSGVRVYDAYHPKAREIYWKYLNKWIYPLGIDGWWMDSTEPDHFERQDRDYNQKTYLGSFRKYRNLYPLMTVGGVYDRQRMASSEKRVFILTRSAFAGQQRYGANSWSGDVVSDWPEFKNQISAGLNFSLCGIPYWNSDIGGFFVSRYSGGVENVAYRELYVRWLQFGAFCPMMRSHGADTPREIYQFGKKGDLEYDAIEKFINLRYRFLPYIYSTSWQTTVNASSMMRALMMDFSHDKAALDINDQYMFGKAILVHPVTEPQYTSISSGKATASFSKIKSTNTYLPSETIWYDFWTGENFEGGRSVERPTPMDIMPIYIKAGSVLPLGPKVQYANEKTGPIEIRVYPGADGNFMLYDDERDNYNYEKGEYATIEFHWNDKTKTLTIGERNGSYPGMPKETLFHIGLVGKDEGVGLESSRSSKPIKYKGKKIMVKLGPAE